MSRPKICVVGASNIDLVSYAPRLPKLGETLPGTRFQMGFGGKGANQAAMAAKLGADVTIITKLGWDLFGDNILDNFRSLGMDTTHVYQTDESFTGVAPIWVDESSGNNAIIVALGANALLTGADIQQAGAAITGADVIICQWECPVETSLTALRLARQSGSSTIFNPAPIQGELPDEAYTLSDILCTNESETELLTGMPVETIDQAAAAAVIMRERGAGLVILTLGERGSLLVTGTESEHVPAPKVRAVDTTGAGDAFVGTLAYALAQQMPIKLAVQRANAVAAMSVQAPGAQESFPTAEQIRASSLVT